MQPAGFAIPAAAILLVGCGCTILRTPEAQINFAAERYVSAAILYRAGSGLPAGGAGSPPVQPSNPTARSASPHAGPVIQTLAIKYPHPAGRPGYARVELVVEKVTALDGHNPESQSGWLNSLRRATRDYLPGVAFGDNVLVAWGMDLPVSQLDPIVGRLQSQGFFGEANSDARDVSLSARVNGAGADKPWSHVPELDAVMVRVRKEGSIISHKGSLAQAFGTAPALSPAAPTQGALTPALAPAMTPAATPAGAPVLEPLPRVEPTR